MSQKKPIFLTISQIVLGSAIGLASGWVCRFIVESLIWEGLIRDAVQHGFWVGLLLLISFGLTYGCTIAGVTEGVRIAGRWFDVLIDRKNAYQGAFLGAPAIVALMLLLDIHWDMLIAPNFLVSLLFAVARVLVFIISLPIYVLLEWVKCPPELLYILAPPIGAILGYRLDWKRT
ncbi:MAG: hypothetical protein OXP71_17820 [Candidatus Poribacteria bacterium]|nr:hypothetical protein [Candidatus Poribacteria bacterium]